MNNTQPTKHPLVFDELLTRCMGEIEFAQKILRDFLETSQPLMDEIKLCISTSSIPDAAQRVHRLKGTAATVAARPFLESLVTLEQLLRSEPDSMVNELSEQFVTSCEKFNEVQAYIESNLLTR